MMVMVMMMMMIFGTLYDIRKPPNSPPPLQGQDHCHGGPRVCVQGDAQGYAGQRGQHLPFQLQLGHRGEQAGRLEGGLGGAPEWKGDQLCVCCCSISTHVASDLMHPTD